MLCTSTVHRHTHYFIYYCMLYTSTHALLLLHVLLHAVNIDTHITAYITAYSLRQKQCVLEYYYCMLYTLTIHRHTLRLYIDTRITAHILLHAPCIDTRITAYITPCLYTINACSIHRLHIDTRSLYRHTHYCVAKTHRIPSVASHFPQSSH